MNYSKFKLNINLRQFIPADKEEPKVFDSLKDYAPPLGYRIGIYVRNTAEDQEKLEKQEAELKAFVQKQNLLFDFGEIVKIFMDPYGSGNTADRPGLQGLLKAVADKEIDLILIINLTRLARSTLLFHELLRDIFCAGCNLISLHDNFHLLDNETLKDFFGLEKYNVKTKEKER
jgi:DNA invertase Pin-like site-specific DNA recombinase